MKIAFISLKGMPLGGGIERFTEETGSRLARMGHEVIVYTMKHYGSTSGMYKGMRIITLPTIKSRILEKPLLGLIATIHQCFEKNINIVFYPGMGSAMFGFIPRLMGRTVINQGQGLEWKRTKWSKAQMSLLKILEAISVKTSSRLTVVSEVQRKYLSKTYGAKSVMIPNGVAPAHKESPEIIKEYGLQGGDYILFAARLVREKGAHYLIEAYKKLDTNMKLVIAGDAQYEERYKAELYELAEGNENILFPGFVTGKRLAELFTNCYMFVLPSVIEGLPLALLEAMSYGNCVLVSDIPENTEALDNIGYTFTNKDVSNLKEKLQELIDNKDMVEAMRARSEEHVIKNYSWDLITKQFEEFFTETLQGKYKR